MYDRIIMTMFFWAALIVGVTLPSVVHAREEARVECSIAPQCEAVTDTDDHHRSDNVPDSSDHAVPHHHCNIDVARPGLPMTEPMGLRSARTLPHNSPALPSRALAPPIEPPAA